jgi:universal stress protein E
MRRFKNILVGVDLSQGDRFVSCELPRPNMEAVERAIWLAKLNSARLCFFNAIDVSATTQRLIEESNGGMQTVVDESARVLQEFVDRASGDGVEATMEVRFGKSWMELIRRVLDRKQDLVICGTRHQGMIRGLLMGSTGMKLLRKCPCPVWITQPQETQEIRSILVAHDMRPVGDLAMELGCSMAELHGAQLHVVHSVDAPELHHVLPASVLVDALDKLTAEADHHIREQLGRYNFSKPPGVHIVTAPADSAISDLITDHNIELLVMGTVGRTGVAGFLVGNTAERLLPRIPCSVLAVKPAAFVCPIVP